MSTVSTAGLNAANDALVDLVDVGAGTATMVFYAGGVGGTTLVTFNLPNPAFGASSSGSADLNSTPITAVAGATGTVNAYGVEDRNGTQVWSGDVGTGSEEIVIDNASITSSQSVNLNDYSMSATNP